MIWQLLLRAEKNDNVEDYYSKLIENREQKNKEREVNKNGYNISRY